MDSTYIFFNIAIAITIVATALNNAGALPYKPANVMRCSPAVLSYDTCKFDNPPGFAYLLPSPISSP